MTWHALPTCQLCDLQSLDVSRAIVTYREPDLEDNRYHSILRCRDHAACRKRVEAAGEPWPLEDDPAWRRRSA